MRPRLTRLDPERRDALRAELVAAIPRSYRPWLHLACPSLGGIGIMVACALLVRDLAPWQLLMVPVAFLILNASEWRIHKGLLHHRVAPLQFLYDEHTPKHHMIYLTDDMAMRSRSEFRLVLIPFYGVFVAAAAALPIPLLLHFVAHQRNLALFFMATAMGYVVGYEWLHLSFHFPPDSFIGRRRVIGFLRRHHAVHHAPELMQKWNFNVTVPLWDLVRRTVYRGPLPSEKIGIHSAHDDA